MTSKSFEWPAGTLLANRSRELGLAYFVPDDTETVDTPHGFYLGRGGQLQRVERGVVYRARELQHLVSLHPSLSDLQAIHEVKRAFGVEVTAARPRIRRRFTEEEIAELWAGWPKARRELYLSARLQALARLGTDEERATHEERVIAASWATERALAAKLEAKEVAP